jgi:nucleoside-diphosphate-sugar epimerase
MNVPDEHFRNVNVEGTRALLDAAVANGVRRFAYGSTIGVYGFASEGRLDEDSPMRPQNIYGCTKLEAEQLVRTYAGRIEPVVLRISETYGPGDFRLLKLFRAIKRGRFMMIGPGANQHQVIYVDDLSHGLLLGVTHPAAIGETYVLAGQDVMTTKEMVTKVAAALDLPPPRLRLPLWPFIPAALLLEMTLRPLGIQPPLHRRRLDFFRKSFLFSTEKATKQLGFVPAIGFAEGSRSTARWYSEQGML